MCGVCVCVCGVCSRSCPVGDLELCIGGRGESLGCLAGPGWWSPCNGVGYPLRSPLRVSAFSFLLSLFLMDEVWTSPSLYVGMSR